MIQPSVLLSRFVCLGCAARHPMTRPLTECPACGSLLEVVSEVREFGLSGAGWRAVFDRRRGAPPS